MLGPGIAAYLILGRPREAFGAHPPQPADHPTALELMLNAGNLA
jgi:hypothetical protein